MVGDVFKEDSELLPDNENIMDPNYMPSEITQVRSSVTTKEQNLTTIDPLEKLLMEQKSELRERRPKYLLKADGME